MLKHIPAARRPARQCCGDGMPVATPSCRMGDDVGGGENFVDGN